MLNQQTKTSRSRLAPLLFMVAFFSGTVFAAWAWFHIGVEQNPEDGIRLQVSTNVPGYTFKPEPISEGAIAILGTTNFINGVFYKDDSDNPNADAIKVFFATWEAKDGKGLTVLHHTPDICWVGVGWKWVDMGYPPQAAIPMNSEMLLFECRSFQAPNSINTELVLWTTLIGGRVLPEQSLFRTAPSHSDGKALQTFSSRNLNAQHLVTSISRRLPARGAKQFIRFSAATNRDDALLHLEQFVKRWLEYAA
jgi:hypothetical protein